MKWLITGGCGFIGRSLLARLAIEGCHEVRIIDSLCVGSREDLEAVTNFHEVPSPGPWVSNRVELYIADIRDKAAVSEAARGADVVLHLAANTGVGPSVEDPYADCENNVMGTLNVLEAARETPGQRVVFASSGAPLGVQVPPLHEEMAPRPASPYGASKLAGEGYCSAYYHCFGVETVALRFGNVYGPRSGHKASVIAKFIKEALSGDSLEIYGDGRQTRDFIFIDDLVDAIYKAATIPGVGGEVFQIATAKETTVHELADDLVSALVDAGVKRPEVVYGSPRQGDVPRSFSDTSKAREMLGWTAGTNLSDGLKVTVESFM